MSVNLEYYKTLLEQIKMVLAIIDSMKPIIVHFVQFAEDNMPNSKGGEKLKYVAECLRGALAQVPEVLEKLDPIWDTFVGLVGAFAKMQKLTGAVKSSGV
jgi:hypothetical protein